MEARVAISMASRSNLPLWREPVAMTSSNVATSLAASRWIASAVFFLWGQGLFHRSCAADLLVHFQQLAAEFTEAVKGLDLTLRFVQFGAGGEGFTDCLAVDLASQAVVGAVARLAALMAVAVGFAAAATDRSDRTAAEIAQLEDLGQDCGSLLFEGSERIKHVVTPAILTYSYVRISAIKKKKLKLLNIYVAHPPRRSGERKNQ